jgi:ferredoxin
MNTEMPITTESPTTSEPPTAGDSSRTSEPPTANEDGHDPSVGVRVRTHPALCSAWGNCHRWAPHIYALDDEGYIDVHRLAVPPEHAEEAWIGASVCPERAITVIGPPERYWAERRVAAEAAAEAAEEREPGEGVEEPGGTT